jgi:hypothetical protein
VGDGATASQVTVEQPHGMTGYGYHWWTTTAGSHPAAVAWGFGGQLIEVVPDLGLVVVVSTPFVDGPLFRGPAPLLGLVDKSIAPAADRS